MQKVIGKAAEVSFKTRGEALNLREIGRERDQEELYGKERRAGLEEEAWWGGATRRLDLAKQRLEDSVVGASERNAPSAIEKPKGKNLWTDTDASVRK